MYSRPTLSEIVTRTRADLVSRLSADDILRRADADVYARVLAGLAHGLYGYVDFLANQIIYDTAEAEFLARWASIWGVTRKPAAVATGSVTFTVSSGAVISSGTLLQALDGVQYQTTADATVSAPTATGTSSGMTASRTSTATWRSAVAACARRFPKRYPKSADRRSSPRSR